MSQHIFTIPKQFVIDEIKKRSHFSNFGELGYRNYENIVSAVTDIPDKEGLIQVSTVCNILKQFYTYKLIAHANREIDSIIRAINSNRI